VSEAKRIAILFDIDGTLLITGGVGSHNFDVDQLLAAGADYAIASLTEGLPL
jgi:hypothetical protein